MDPKDLELERRKQRRLEKLGTQHPCCSVPGCGETDWRCLELHHIADHGCDPQTVILCANCHRKISDAQKDHSPHDDAADPFLESVGRFLLGLAELLKLTIDSLVRFGEALIHRASGETA
jgi:hypothetical protein